MIPAGSNHELHIEGNPMLKPHVLLQFRGSLLSKVTLRTQINRFQCLQGKQRKFIHLKKAEDRSIAEKTADSLSAVIPDHPPLCAHHLLPLHLHPIQALHVSHLLVM